MNVKMPETEEKENLPTQTIELPSQFLERAVRVDFYGHALSAEPCSLLLINDGQDLVKMQFENIVAGVHAAHPLKPLLVAAIHCGPDRINEYGMSVGTDYKGRGAKAALYEQFILAELMPFMTGNFGEWVFSEIAFAGFSLGALSAFDIAWNHPELFSRVGVFSGSLWWRSVNQTDKEYNQAAHRLIHAQVRNAEPRPGMKFFFECGELDESLDRNKNGVIDSIDDTIDLMRELVRKGYREGRDLYYLQMADGRHDVPSWAKAIPTFLSWGWSALT